MRVGYAQSNFNADNCLVSGRTVDFGPFGFIEKYDPGWAMWIGSGDHFGFMNQPRAAKANWEQLAKSIAPLLDDDRRAQLERVVQRYDSVSTDAMHAMLSAKLGLRSWGPRVAELWEGLEWLLRAHATDYTIAWRELARIAELAAGDDRSPYELIEPLQRAFASAAPAAVQQRWAEWIEAWVVELHEQRDDLAEAARGMRLASPKYIPREWMLVEAYSAAEAGDFAPLHRLQRLFRRPYDEHDDLEQQYYRSAPPAVARKGGVGFMS